LTSCQIYQNPFTPSTVHTGENSQILTVSNKKIYLQFLSYALKLINTINIEFQWEKSRLHQLLPRVSLTYRQILKNYLKADYVNQTEINKINKLLKTNKETLIKMEFFCVISLLKKLFLFVLERITL
jgi:hypothetical protein